MRKSPPLSQFVRFPVTAGIAAMAIAVTALAMSGRSIDALTMSVVAFDGEPWRILTSALPHADILHIVFNVCWLWVFGTAIEQVYGPVRTFAIFLGMQAGAALAEYALFRGGIGLSGIGYGLFGLVYALAKRDPRFADAIDTRTTQLFIGWFVICIVLTVTNLMAVGNVAHGAGAVLGGLLGFALTAKRTVVRIALAAAFVAVIGIALVGATVARPAINLSRYGGADSSQLGYDALGEGHNADAIRYLERAVAVTPSDSGSWFNLGIALDGEDRHREAIDAYRRSYAIDPTDFKHRQAVAEMVRELGMTAVDAHDDRAAVPLLRESLALVDDGATWTLLGDALVRLGERAPASDAYRRATAAYLKVGRTDDAQGASGKATALDAIPKPN